MRVRRALVLVGGLLLVGVTVLVFRAIDHGSHSASDTLRPFVLTMTPVWVVGVGAAVLLLRERTGQASDAGDR